jgi:hypothetical protein
VVEVVICVDIVHFNDERRLTPPVSTKYGRQSIEGYDRDGDLLVDRSARHEPDSNRTQDIRFIQV